MRSVPELVITEKAYNSFYLHIMSMSSRNKVSRSARKLQGNTASTQKSTHEDLVAASHAVEQELNVVKALKRLSIGNSFNYDPDLPPDESDLIDVNAYIDLNRSPTQRSVTSTSTVSSSSSKSSNSYKRSSLCEEQHVNMNEQDNGNGTRDLFDDKENKREIQRLTRNKLRQNAMPREGTQQNQESDVDAEDVMLESNKLMWVPATAHPKLAPENFRKYVQETVQEITTKLDRTRSKRSSLSRESSKGDNEGGGLDKASDEDVSRRTSSSSANSSKNSRQPSLKELSTELENLSHLAGMDSTDAVTLARTLSSSSLGFTQMEKDLYASSDSALKRTDSLPGSSSIVNTDNGDSSSSTSDTIDENLPIPTSGIGSGLRRARWTTYRRKGRPNIQKLQNKGEGKQNMSLERKASTYAGQLVSEQNGLRRKSSRTPVRSFSTPLPSSSDSVNSGEKSLSRTPSSRLPPLPVPNEKELISASQKSNTSPKKKINYSKHANTSPSQSSPTSATFKHSGWKWLKEKTSTRNESQNEKCSDHFEGSANRTPSLEPLVTTRNNKNIDDSSDKAAAELDLSTPSPSSASSTFSNIFHFRSHTSDDNSSQSSKSFKTVFGSHRHHKHEVPAKEQVHGNEASVSKIDEHGNYQDNKHELQANPSLEKVKKNGSVTPVVDESRNHDNRYSNVSPQNVTVQESNYSSFSRAGVASNSLAPTENRDLRYEQQNLGMQNIGSPYQQSYVERQNQANSQIVDQCSPSANPQIGVHRHHHHHHQRTDGQHRQDAQFGGRSDERMNGGFSSGNLTVEQSQRQKYQMRVLRQHRHRTLKGQQQGSPHSAAKNPSAIQGNERRTGIRQKSSRMGGMKSSHSPAQVSRSQNLAQQQQMQQKQNLGLSQNQNQIQVQGQSRNQNQIHDQRQISRTGGETSSQQDDKQEVKAKSQLPMVPEPSTEALKRSLKVARHNTKANQPLEMRDSAFGFPLPPVSKSTVVMLDYRFPIHVERAVYRLSHLKLADPKRPLYQQVLLSNFMYAYLNLVNHTLYLQQQQQEQMYQQQQREIGDSEEGYSLNGNQQQMIPSEGVVPESQEGMMAGGYGIAAQQADSHY